MKIGSMIAIYFVTWWVVLFAVLPWGVRSAAEEGVQVEEGHEPGAPVAHGMMKKAGITTVVSAVLFGVVYYVLTHGVLG
jgi:predicted secreted protein